MYLGVRKICNLYIFIYFCNKNKNKFSKSKMLLGYINNL